MTVLFYITSCSIAFIIKAMAGKLFYKRFGKKYIKHFNLSIALIALIAMIYFNSNYTNSHPLYPIMFGGFIGFICSNFRVPSDKRSL